MAKKKETATFVDTRARPTYTKGTIYIGMDQTMEVLPPTKAKQHVQKQSVSLLFLPVTIAVSGLMGLLAYTAVRYGRFRFMSEAGFPAETDTTIWLQNGGAATLLGLVLAMIFGMRSPLRLFCVLLGVGVAMAGFHNLVHLYPTEFGQIFSPEWVSQLRGQAPNQTWLYMGQFTRF